MANTDFGFQNEQGGCMKKFSSDQMIFALLVGAVIVGIAIYRYFFMF